MNTLPVDALAQEIASEISRHTHLPYQGYMAPARIIAMRHIAAGQQGGESIEQLTLEVEKISEWLAGVNRRLATRSPQQPTADPLDAAISKGTKAWAGVPDSFVEDLRGEGVGQQPAAGHFITFRELTDEEIAASAPEGAGVSEQMTTQGDTPSPDYQKGWADGMQEATAILEADAEDAARLDWLAHHGAALRHDNSSSVKGWHVHAPYHTGIHCVDDHHRFLTARDAIDAARKTTGGQTDA